MLRRSCAWTKFPCTSALLARALEYLPQNAQPIAAQNFFNLLVAEAALDQLANKVAGVRMVAQVREKMRSGEFCFQLFPFRNGHLAPEEFAEVEADTHAIHADEIRDVFE